MVVPIEEDGEDVVVAVVVALSVKIVREVLATLEMALVIKVTLSFSLATRWHITRQNVMEKIMTTKLI